MGAYLSQPITKKESSDHEGSKLSCGASSMQGWRIYQEDAHNVIIDFDEKKSLFAVYDGHGGSEVALYTSQHLPEFIKNTAEFKKGNYKQALIDAFMEFDESLIKDEVMAILKTLKNENEGEDSYPATDEDALDENDDENVSNLYEEATMPLSEVISRYRNPVQRLKESGGKPMSPCLKAKDKKIIKEAGEGCSSSSSFAEVAGSSSSSAEADMSSSSKPAENKAESESAAPSKAEEPSSSDVKSEEAPPSDANTTTPTSTADTTSSTNNHTSSGNDVTSSSTKPEENRSGSVETQSNGEKKENGEEVKTEKNGEKKEEVISPSKAKPIKGKAKDKPLIITNGDSSEAVDSKAALTNGNGKKRTSPRKLGTKNLLESTMEDDSSESDEDFKVDEDSSSDDDEADNSHLPNDDEEDVSDEDEDLDEEEEDSDEDDSDFDGEGAEGLSREDIQKRMKEALDHKDIPGMDSGCTAVVVLFVDNQVYIANAGDSRAVLCRDALAKDLSEDHKPEDEAEKERIVKAGGEVTPDGRVNGGLNLSRALGDHSYKQTSSLPLSQQMITALPDVETLSLTPGDEFIVIACDGIWNSLSSQEVVDFVRERIHQEGKKLSAICEELFDKCLAPDSLGDGTGCDNMTCVLVKLNSSADPTSASVAPSVGSAKRSRDPEPSQGEKSDSGDKTNEESHPAKKPKTESAAEPTSSVAESAGDVEMATEAKEV